jgi:hypothetical protein
VATYLSPGAKMSGGTSSRGAQGDDDCSIGFSCRSALELNRMLSPGRPRRCQQVRATSDPCKGNDVLDSPMTTATSSLSKPKH